MEPKLQIETLARTRKILPIGTVRILCDVCEKECLHLMEVQTKKKIDLRSIYTRMDDYDLNFCDCECGTYWYHQIRGEIPQSLKNAIAKKKI